MLSIEPNERVTYKVCYQDDELLVVAKPARRVTLPGVGHERDTLLNGLFAAYGAQLQNLGQPRDFGLLHRLDRETSGLVVVALSNRAYDGMRAAFAERKVRKFYWAVTHKAPEEREGVIRLPIEELVERHGPYSSLKSARVIHQGSTGKSALTAYRVLHESATAALIEARPVTGRLHQVRVHLSAIGATVLGDELYGPRKVDKASPRLALHAHRVAFDHPVTCEMVDVKLGWPSDLRALLRRLELPRPDLELQGENAEGGE